MFRVKQCLEGVWRGSKGGLDALRSGLNARRAGLALIIAAGLAGCSSPEDVAQGAGVTAKATSSNSTSASASASSSSSNGATSFEDNAEQDGGSREFAYGWPAAVSAIPALAARLKGERDSALAEQKAEWQDSLREFAGEDCVSCTSRGYSKEWKVVADLPRYLSLSADMYLYTGGAHGNSAFEALVWDREAGAALDPKAMFRSEAAMQDALGAVWCKALKEERGKRLGAEYAVENLGVFGCPPIADLTLLVGSSDAKAFNCIGLIAAPYVAGAYAEGPYEVTLPVTPAVLAAVKPEYKAGFALQKVTPK
jgi:hypothetical protein